MKPPCCRPFFAGAAAGGALVLMLLAPAGGCRSTTGPPPEEAADAVVETVEPTVTSEDPGEPEMRVVERPAADAEPIGDGQAGDAQPAGPEAVPGLDAALSSLADLGAGDLLPAAQPVGAVEAKLDGVLLELVRARRTDGEAGVRAYVERHQPGLSADRLLVEIVCESAEDTAAIRELVVTAGGAVTTSFDNHIWAAVPLTSVETLAEVAAVWTIALDQALLVPQGR